MPPAKPILVLRWLRTPGLSAAREQASVILDEAEALLDPVSDTEGFMLACLVDASTGMVLASRKDQDDISLPTAADIANVFSQLTGELPVDKITAILAVAEPTVDAALELLSVQSRFLLRPRPSPSRSR
jgi:hypothetical protein